MKKVSICALSAELGEVNAVERQDRELNEGQILRQLEPLSAR